MHLSALAPSGVLIGGTWEDGASRFDATDKYTGIKLADIAIPSREQVARAVVTTHAAVLKGVPPPPAPPS